MNLRRPTRLAALAALALLLCLSACGGGGGGAPNPAPAGTYLDATAYSSLASASLSAANEVEALLHGQTLVAGRAIAWTGHAAHLAVPDPVSGQVQAAMFHVSYLADAAASTSTSTSTTPPPRPLMFFFNGGPGSASAWLHLGSFAPRRLVTGIPALTQVAPFPQVDKHQVDNAESLIDVSDLVFVDAVGTGWSQAVAPFRNDSFWGVDADARLFRDFVLRYLDASGRRASPVYLFGESYGTVRASVLARLLVQAGVPVRGVVLQSSILDYNSNCGVFEPVAGPCTGFLPSYAATAAWFRLLQPAPAPADVPAFLDTVALQGDSQWGPALADWLAQRTALPEPLVTTLATDTALPASLWRSTPNLGPSTVRHQLLPGQVLGIYDGRMAAATGSLYAQGDDPSSSFIQSPFSVAIARVLAQDFGYTNPSTYTLSGSAINTWNFSHGGLSLPDVVPDLQTALTLAPQLRILSLAGRHDLITPWHQTARDLARLGDPARVTLRNYDGGHMTYLDDTSRPLERADLLAFLRLTGGTP